MTPEERQLLSELFERVRTAGASPRDRDAEAFIADAVRALPYSPYLLAQTVIVQEQTLAQAASRIEQLEARVKELEAAPQAPAAGSFLGGLGKSIFGGEPARPAAAPQPAPSPWSRAGAAPQGFPGAAPAGYAPAPAAPQPSPWQQPQAAPAAGGGFLKAALGTAAGVAGGVMLANSLGGLLGGGHHGSGAQGFGSGADRASSGNDSLLDRPHSAAAAYQAPQDDTQEHSRIDDGLGSQPASYDSYDTDSGGSTYGDDSTDV